jgi:transcriptional regulator with XRE-family HTH domain
MSDEPEKPVVTATKPTKRPRVDARRTTMVDAQIGRNIRKRRIELGLSQTELAEACGVTFQQVQKYENGFNRVAAARLWQFAAVLGLEIPDFFEGLGKPTTRAKPPILDAGARVIDDETAKVARLVASIKDVKLRQRIKTMLTAMVAGQE